MVTTRFAFLCEYDGSGFNGWQIQPKAKAKQTVQGVLEKAFATALRQDFIRIHGSGRTDTGVHASGQCFHADLPEKTDLFRLIPAVNGIMKDHPVAILVGFRVKPDFHARFSARSRTYHYTINSKPSPLNRHQEWFYPRPLNVDMLHEMAGMIAGQRDFTSFCRIADESDTKDCTILQSRWEQQGSRLIYVVQANRFLYGMVRALVGTQLEILRLGLKPAHLADVFEGKNRELAGAAAKAHGLNLIHVDYADGWKL